ncbi:MAG: sugar ABC transporter ATP-binding protein [Lentisphaerae bacterium]|nr:sugar ABC transporter ATP-binding protein [Lentisphaerota bacterium]
MSAATPAAPLVEMESISKDFAGVRALDGVSLSVRPGEVHGLIGENGAGKSTLVRILDGVLRPSAGQLRRRGAAVAWRGPGEAQRHGIAMIHQELHGVGELSVAENILLGREPSRGGFLRREAMAATARDCLASIGCDLDPWRPFRSLSLAEQQMVEIAKALSQQAEVLIMDEPTAVLTQREVGVLLSLIGDLRRRGMGIIYISHILGDVLAVCDRVTVLRDGVVVRRLDDLSGVTEADLANEMVGRALSDQFPPRAAPGAGVVFEARGIVVPGRVDDVSFALREGEIFGLAGLIGAGRTELGEALAGLRRRRAGSIVVRGRPCRSGSPGEAIREGIAYVSEDRRGTGLVLGMGIRENLTLAALRQFGRVVVGGAAERAAAARQVRDFGIRVGRLDDDVATLSGGNQQKVALAKWLEVRPAVIILDEPTRGIDIGAKAEIYRLIHRLAAEGLIVIVISSEMNELLGLCHRIGVMRAGRLAGVVEAAAASDRDLMRLAAGVASTEGTP